LIADVTSFSEDFVTTPGTPVKNNLGWGIAGLLLFWPVGLFGLLKAVKVNGLAAAGDIAGATEAAESAKKLGKIAVIVGVVLYVLWCVFGVLLAGAASTAGM
jgi:hypothetical protein